MAVVDIHQRPAPEIGEAPDLAHGRRQFEPGTGPAAIGPGRPSSRETVLKYGVEPAYRRKQSSTQNCLSQARDRFISRDLSARSDQADLAGGNIEMPPEPQSSSRRGLGHDRRSSISRLR